MNSMKIPYIFPNQPLAFLATAGSTAWLAKEIRRFSPIKTLRLYSGYFGANTFYLPSVGETMLCKQPFFSLACISSRLLLPGHSLPSSILCSWWSTSSSMSLNDSFFCGWLDWMMKYNIDPLSPKQSQPWAPCTSFVSCAPRCGWE